MHPVLFWSLGVISLVASAMAVGHPKPLITILGLLVLMLANSLILLFLSSTLVGIEWIAISLGGLIIIWALLVRPRKLNLGPPGRARLNITRLSTMAVMVCFLVTVVWSSMHQAGSVAPCAAHACLSEQHGAWISLFLLGMSTVVACVLVLSRNRQRSDRDRN